MHVTELQTRTVMRPRRRFVAVLAGTAALILGPVLALGAEPLRKQSSHIAGSPRLPYEDHGACPFECCTYAAWTANTRTRVHKDRRTDAPLVFEIREGEDVQGLTGVVVTTKLGVAKIFKEVELGQKRLKAGPGEPLYVLHYVGEGNWKFWLRGEVDIDEIPDIDDTAPNSKLALRIAVRPTTVWWVKIRNSQGLVGWSNQPDHFDHKDACE